MRCFQRQQRAEESQRMDRQRLESCLQAAGDTIDQEYFDKLIKSMLKRVEACIAADGWHTKY